MSIIDPLAVSNRPLEPGPGRNIPKLARNGAAFQEADGDGHMSAENLGTLLRQVSKPSVDQLIILSASFKRFGESYRPMVIAFNATSRSTGLSASR